MSFFKKLFDQLKRLFRRKKDAPSETVAPVAPPPDVEVPVSSLTALTVPSEPSASGGETLLQAAQRRNVPVVQWAALQLFATYRPDALTPDQLIDLFQAENAVPAPAENPTILSHGYGRIPISTFPMTQNDLRYLWGKQLRYRLVKQNGDVFREIFAGSHAELNQAIQRAEQLNPNGDWNGHPDNVALVQLVEDLFDKVGN